MAGEVTATSPWFFSVGGFVGSGGFVAGAGFLPVATFTV
jgi:hypothetical protein